MGMKYGYARVSTSGQELDSQLRALKQAGCEKIVSEVASGALRSRPQLDTLLSQLVAGDTLVVYRLDRLGRSLQHLIGLLSDLTSTGVHFISLSEAIDTTTAQGRLMMAMTAALAEFERDSVIRCLWQIKESFIKIHQYTLAQGLGMDYSAIIPDLIKSFEDDSPLLTMTDNDNSYCITAIPSQQTLIVY